MAFSENVRDALVRVHTATRALQIARDVREREWLTCHFPVACKSGDVSRMPTPECVAAEQTKT